MWSQAIDRAGQRQTDLLLYFGPELDDPPGQLQWRECVKSPTQQKCNQPVSSPDRFLDFTARNIEIRGEDNPIALLAERGYPFDIRRIRRKSIAKMNDLMPFWINQTVKRARQSRREIVVEEKLQAAASCFSKRTAFRTAADDTSNQRAAVRYEPVVVNA